MRMFPKSIVNVVLHIVESEEFVTAKLEVGVVVVARLITSVYLIYLSLLACAALPPPQHKTSDAPGIPAALLY